MESTNKNPNPKSQRFYTGMVLFLLLKTTFLQAAEPSPNAKLQQAPTPELIMNDDYWPPYAFGGREGHPKGFIKEIVERCAPSTGYKINFVPYPIARTRAFMESGVIDFHVYSYDKARESFLNYGTEPLFTSAYQPAVRAASEIKIDSIADFDPLRMGGLLGLVYTPEFKKYIDDRAAKGRYDVTDQEAVNIIKLMNNRIDVFVNHKNTILWFAGQQGYRDRVKVLDYVVKRANYFVSLSKKSPRLQGEEATRFLASMDSCIRQLKSTSFYQQLTEKYHIEE
ncbi:MAG: amino acid ABC transporter substrate-binding protein [Deltaproteobacteria bacterium]|nr:amino acid ABC transporter substrate-binding protein [Deltaproteobacteria bacterium]